MQKLYNIVIATAAFTALTVSFINLTSLQKASGKEQTTENARPAEKSTESAALPDTNFREDGFSARIHFWKSLFLLDTSRSFIASRKELDILYVIDNPRREEIYDSLKIKAASEGVDLILMRGMKERIQEGIAASAGYLFLKDTLKSYELPERLFWLPLLESNFNDKAYSKAHAVGAYQFIKWTGRRYGLKVNRYVDERKNRFKAAGAYAKHLRKLFDKFHHEEIAVTAYNRGENANDIKHIPEDNPAEILDRLGFAPSNYYAEFLAISKIASNPGTYLLDIPESPDYNKPFITLRAPEKISDLLEKTGAKANRIRELNPWLKKAFFRRDRHLPAGTTVILPLEAATKAYASENTGPLFTAQEQTKKIFHIIRKGETLESISRLYPGTSVRSIIKINSIKNPRLVFPGDSITIVH
ncbi:MAG: transglycosylase SLT domain-containing protein [Fibrobacterota bacterium]